MKSVYKSNDVNWNSMPIGGRRYMGLSPLLFIHLPAFGGWRWRKPGSSRISWKVLRSSPPIPGVSLDQPRCKASLLLGPSPGLCRLFMGDHVGRPTLVSPPRVPGVNTLS